MHRTDTKGLRTVADFDRDTLDRLAEVTAAGSESEELITRTKSEPGVLSLITPDNWQRTNIDLEDFAPNPRRAKGTFAFTRAGSFVAYVNRHKAINPAPLLVATDEGAFTCYLDPHDAAPGWHEHRATFALKATPAWKAWQSADSRPMAQSEFAEFLEDRIGEIASPPAGDLFELTRSLRVKQDIEFDAGMRLQDGQVRLTYREKQSAAAGAKGEIEVPETLSLVVRAYEGTEPIHLVARFRYRMSEGKASFTYLLGEEITRVRAAAVADAADDIADGTGHPVLYGTKAG